MPIELGIWRIDGQLTSIQPTPLHDERLLEDVLARDPALVDPNVMIIGRQVLTTFGKYADLLAINAEGELVLIELKRSRTPREVVAQTLDYGSWVKDLSYEQVKAIYEQGAGQHEPAVRFEQAFARRFGVGPPETLNEAHNLIVVVSELDPSTERIISYLAEEFGVPINAVLFQHFQDGGHHYLTRTWLRDPRIAEAQTPKGKRETWNGVDFYVSFGDGEHRSWEDARRYHFVSGGQGSWYSKTLKMLTLHSRIFVHIPGQGYVGVGTVIDLAVPINEFMVDVDGRHVPILSAPGLKAHRMEANKDDPERSEWLVRVQWIDARPREQAYWETGMFANQNTACRLRNKFTLEKLRAHFRLED